MEMYRANRPECIEIDMQKNIINFNKTIIACELEKDLTTEPRHPTKIQEDNFRIDNPTAPAKNTRKNPKQSTNQE